MNAERQAWLQERQKGTGGSDVAAMLGLSKWKSPYQLYLDKRGELPEQEDNEAMYWGRELEPVIRRRYEQETGLTVIENEGIIVDPIHPFMLANLDGRIDENLILEIKTARTGDGWGEIGTAEIPLAYSLQCQWYLARTGAAVCDVAVLIGGSDFRLYKIEADAELQKILEEAAIEFWQRVQDGNPPDVITYEDAVERYGHAPASGNVWATEEVYETWSALKQTREELNQLEEKEKSLKAELCKFMADSYDTILDPEGKPLATWKLAKPTTRFDAKTFEQAHPDLYNQYKTTGEASRRLLLK